MSGSYISTLFLSFREVYQKFNVFLLTEYKRVILMDADGFALHNLDHLFTMKLPEGTKLASSQSYWFDHQGVEVGWQDDCLGDAYKHL